MKIQIDKKKDAIIFIPEESIDSFHCGLIHRRMPSVTIITFNTDNPKRELSSLEIRKDILINELIKSGN